MEFQDTNRIVVLVDMDCFYCQVEENLNPALKDKPIAVVQYNAWRGGGVIAVNYPAKDKGVTRHMRGNEAKKVCPDIELVSVPCVRGKANLTKYREAGKRVAEVLQTFTDILERASVDEAYLDITNAVNKKLEHVKHVTITQLENTHVVNCDTKDFLQNLQTNDSLVGSDLKLAVGGAITEEIRAAVYKKTGYKCSAGIAHNKILAKLACGIHKPNQQTILPQGCVQELYKDLPIRKIRSLGGKFGNSLAEDLGIRTMGELIIFNERELVQRYDEKTGSWLYKIARGIDLEPVTTRLLSKSIGCCKKFPGRTALINFEDVTHWINELAAEVSERLKKDMEENNRKAKQVVVSFVQEINKRDVSNSRTRVLNSYNPKKISSDVFDIIRNHCLRADNTFHLKFLGISVGKFEDSKNVQDISSYFITKSATVTEVPSRDNEQQIENNNLSKATLLNFVEDSKQTDTCNGDVTDDCNNELETCSILSADTDIIPYNQEERAYAESYSTSSDSFLQEISGMINNESKLRTDPFQSDSDADSISSEMFYRKRKCSETPAEIVRPSSASYFFEYFDSLKNERLKSPVERNFDTSRYLQEDSSRSNSENETSDSIVNNVKCITKQTTDVSVLNSKHTNYSLNEEDPSCSSFLSTDVKEMCPECNKSIPKNELVGHIDYHFALKLVREEAHLYKNDKANSVKPKKKISESKSVKRKHTDNTCGKLASFLQSKARESGSNDSRCDICVECNKKIPIGDMVIHMDYHVAKKLHVQINPVKTCSVQSMKGSKGKHDVKNNKVPSVMSFFKPL